MTTSSWASRLVASPRPVRILSLLADSLRALWTASSYSRVKYDTWSWGGSECDVTNQPENCVQAIKTSSIYLDSWNHQCSFVLLWLLREGNILQIIIKISVSLCVSFLVLSLIWYLSSFCGVCQELPGFSSSGKIIKVFFAYSWSQMFLFVCMASLFSFHAE